MDIVDIYFILFTFIIQVLEYTLFILLLFIIETI